MLEKAYAIKNTRLQMIKNKKSLKVCLVWTTFDKNIKNMKEIILKIVMPMLESLVLGLYLDLSHVRLSHKVEYSSKTVPSTGLFRYAERCKF